MSAPARGQRGVSSSRGGREATNTSHRARDGGASSNFPRGRGRGRSRNGAPSPNESMGPEGLLQQLRSGTFNRAGQDDATQVKRGKLIPLLLHVQAVIANTDRSRRQFSGI